MPPHLRLYVPVKPRELAALVCRGGEILVAALEYRGGRVRQREGRAVFKEAVPRSWWRDMEGYRDDRGGELRFDWARRNRIGQQLCVIPFGVWLLEGGRGALTSGSAASGWSTGSEVAQHRERRGSGAGRREVEGRSAGGVGLSAERGRRARGTKRAEGERAFAGPHERVLGRGAGLRGERGKEELGWVGCWAAWLVWVQLGFSIFLSLFFFLFQTKLILFEFKFEFEFKLHSIK